MHIGQVSDHVGEHTAGNLVNQRLSVCSKALGVELAIVDVLLLDGLEIIVDLVDDLLIQSGVDAVLLESVEHCLCRRL